MTSDKRILTLLFLFCMVSCHKKRYFGESKKLVFSNKVKLTEVENCLGKQILFIGMHHVGTSKFYSRVEEKVDFLRKSGYKVYYEGVRPDTTSKIYHVSRIVWLRYANIMGSYENIKLQYKDMAAKYKRLETQSEALNLNTGYESKLDSNELDINADVSIYDMVYRYEELYGPCYYPEVSKSEMRKRQDPIILDYRDVVLTNKIKNSIHDKIVIVFGEAHLKGFAKGMQEECK